MWQISWNNQPQIFIPVFTNPDEQVRKAKHVFQFYVYIATEEKRTLRILH